MIQSTSQKDDIKIIREMIEKSSRVLSLSGLSGIFAGVYAIAGAAFAWFFILDMGFEISDSYLINIASESLATTKILLVTDALVVLLLALLTAWMLSSRKASRSGQKLWSPTAARMFSDLFIPLFAGGLFSLIFLFRGSSQFIAPSMLVFYGIALVSTSKYTFGEIRILGLLQILTGLVALLFSGFGLIFWVIGFGFLHIAYGAMLHRKYH